jgi:hypothetical protein
MDKITRILLLYSKLIQGEKINKTKFCMETDSLPRTFDRDIEDIRLYLSEFFHSEELIYDRSINTYYLRGLQNKTLGMAEYLLLERLLIDSRILRNDEISGLLCNLATNTDNSSKMLALANKNISKYDGPLHGRAILKMHGDLATIINNKSVINIKYIKANGDKIDREIVPCEIKYGENYLYLIAFLRGKDKQYPAYFRLDRIYSFAVVRGQFREEKEGVLSYLKKHSKGIIQMYGGKFVEVLLLCKKEYYQYIYDKFQQIKIVKEDEREIYIRINVFEDGFIRWIINQPVGFVKIIRPKETVNKILDMIKDIEDKYMEVHKNGEEN